MLTFLRWAIFHVLQIFKNNISRKSGITYHNDNQEGSISLDYYSIYYTMMSKHIFILEFLIANSVCVHVCMCLHACEREKGKE